MTDDIIREIDDEVRRDQYVKLLKRYAPQITAAVVVLALAGGGFFAWQQYKQSRARQEAGDFAAAMSLESSGKLKEASEAFRVLGTEGGTGYRALAGLQAAAARAQQGDVGGAVALYDSMAADTSLEQRFRDLARLLAVQHLLDTATPEQLDERLKPITGADSLWHYSARELAALVRLKAGDTAGARKAFAALSDDLSAPNDLRSRATEMLAALPGRIVTARRLLTLLLAAGFALALAGCDLLPDWFGQQKKPPLPGQRISVMELERSLNPDPKLADVQVRLPRPYENADWPEDGGYPSHAMYHLKLGYELKQIWRSSIGSGADDEQRLNSQPVAADGKIFTIDAESVVSAYRADTGAKLWSLDMTPESKDAGAIGGGLAFDQGRLFVTTAYGDVVALDARTGKETWRQKIGIPFRTGPTVDDSRVFAISYDNQVHALTEADGKVIWTYSGVAESAELLGGASPAVENGVVIAPLSSGELVALRADSGRVVWSDSLTRAGRVSAVGTINDIRGRPVIDRGQVYAVSHAGRMVAIDLASGERLWEQEISGVQMPWVAGDFIYLVTADSEIVCLARRDGRVRWVRQLDKFEDPDKKKKPISWYGPVLASDRLVLVSSQGHALAVSPYTGEMLGEIVLSDPASLAPVVANATLYILTDDAQLVAFR